MMTAERQTPRRRPRHMARGLALSLLLHAAAGLLAALFWSLPRPAVPPRGPRPVPVDLVELGDETTSPEAARAPVPQQRATETGEHPTPRAVPRPRRAPPAHSPGRKVAARESETRPQPDPHRTPSPQPQEGVGLSNVTAGADGRTGLHAVYGVKDYVRAQIERRWYPRSSALLRNDWVVRLHLQLNQDGSIGSAEIVDLPGQSGSQPDYRDFASSVRNAALLSAPFTLPPDLDDAARDLTLDFNPRSVQQ